MGLQGFRIHEKPSPIGAMERNYVNFLERPIPTTGKEKKWEKKKKRRRRLWQQGKMRKINRGT